MPDAPPEPVRRDMLDQHADTALIRARRQRESETERRRVLTLEAHAVDTANQLRVQKARLSETIMARERILDSRVRQLLQYSLRRCGTCMRHIAYHHPDGNAVISYMRLALPSLPNWLSAMRMDGARQRARQAVAECGSMSRRLSDSPAREGIRCAALAPIHRCNSGVGLERIWLTGNDLDCFRGVVFLPLTCPAACPGPGIGVWGWRVAAGAVEAR